MKTLPPEISAKLQPGLKVVFASRRASYEWVEEVSEAIWRLWLIITLALFIESNFRLFEMGIRPLNYVLVVFIICLFASHHAILEIMKWRNEIYVVARDEANGGGKIYKFEGWLTKKHISEPITSNSPSPAYDNPKEYRLWGWITGEHMTSIKIYSPNHRTYLIEGQRISPLFEKAIQKIQGNPKGSSEEELTPGNLRNLSDIHQAFLNGAIDKRFFRDASQTIIRKAIWND